MSTLLSAGHLPPNRHDDLDNYDVGDDDPFATPSPPSSPPPPKKRKEPASASQGQGGGGGLGIDEEVSVAKRARLPNVKLDEDRLLGANGLPRLRQLARTLKLKGKGHEFSDAARLLSLYQMWLDDLFPKAKFLDALAMVEKAGHKKRVVAARNEFMNEGKPKQQAEHNDDDDHGRQQDVARESVEGAEQEGEGGAQTGGARPTTPSRRQDDGVPDGEDDLYDATPRQQQGRRTTAQDDDGVPGDEDDLDALIAEAEARDQGAAAAAAARRRSPTPDEGDMDDLDALIAEAEAGDGSAGRRVAEHDFGDDEAAMQEMQG